MLRSNKVGRSVAMKLCPHFIGLELYVHADTEEIGGRAE